MRFTDPTGMDWYENDKGNTLWQEGDDDEVEKTYEGPNGSITIRYKRIGERYSAKIGNNGLIHYQNEVEEIEYFDQIFDWYNPLSKTSASAGLAGLFMQSPQSTFRISKGSAYGYPWTLSPKLYSSC